MAADLDKVKSSAMEVKWGDTTIGHTQEGTRIEAGHLTRERRVDAYGETIADLVHVGDYLRVRCRVGEETYANLQMIFPFSLPGASATVYFGYSPGRLGSAKASTISVSSLVASDDFAVYLYKAVARLEGEIPAHVGEDRYYEVVFEALPDESKGEGKKLGRIVGDV